MVSIVYDEKKEDVEEVIGMRELYFRCHDGGFESKRSKT